MRTRLAALAVLSILVADASAGSLAPRRAFPLIAVGARSGATAFRLAPDALKQLGSMREVRFDGVAIPRLGKLDLDLHAVKVRLTSDAVRVDGIVSHDSALDGLSMWSGKVVGHDDSEVFLAFSRAGSRGFVAIGSQRVQLDAAPEAGNDWSHSFSVWRVEDGTPLPGQSATAPYCAGGIARPIVGGSKVAARTPVGGPQKSTSVTPIYEAHVAMETDTQYYALFNDLTAAQNYLFQLLGAISNRYREQIGAILTFPYVGFHTATDNWVAEENGGGSIGLLFEYQAAWQNGQGPVNADVYHFVSGASLGGGVAYLPGLCDQTYGFGVSGNIGGNTPFPIAVGPLNWDFMVIAHELGHNFGAPHTHDYCPTPADECAPNGYFGACQTQQTCTSAGTIMSYCHLCSGGLSNISTYFHPWSVSDCRALVTASCLQFYEGIAYFANLGYALTGTNGTPSLDVNYDAPTDVISFDVQHAPHNRPGTLFIAASTAMLPLYGGTLVPAVQIMVPMNSNGTGNATIAAALPPGSVSLPGGATFYSQAWFSDPLKFVAATNGAEFELILP